MKKHNPLNERIKRKYFTFLKEAKRYNESTVDSAAKALSVRVGTRVVLHS